MKRKLIITLLSAMMLSLPLAGCGNKEVDDINTSVISEDAKDAKETGAENTEKEENKEEKETGNNHSNRYVADPTVSNAIDELESGVSQTKQETNHSQTTTQTSSQPAASSASDVTSDAYENEVKEEETISYEGKVFVSIDEVNIRESASTDAEIISSYTKGDRVFILSEETDVSGMKWYKVDFSENKDGSAVGFAASQYINQVNQIGGAADAE